MIFFTICFLLISFPLHVLSATVDDCLTYQEGYGVGGTPVNLGGASSMLECIDKALKYAPAANGVTFSGGECEARTGQLYVQKSACKQNCFIDPKFPRDDSIPSGCKYAFNGDGKSTWERFVGNAASIKDCYDMVTSKYPDSNGLTMEDPKAFPAKTSFRCFVEHEMTGWPNENKKWLSCFVDDEQLPANQDNPAAADGCLVYHQGVGVGGPALNVGKAKTMEECIKIALQKEPKTNGVTLSGTDCEARTGQLYFGDSGDCKHTCFVNQKITDTSIPSGCVYKFSGDGKSSGEKLVGNAASFKECYDMVTSQFPDSNGMTMENPSFHPGQTTYRCFVEHEMVGWPSANSKWLSCFIDTNAETSTSTNAPTTSTTSSTTSKEPMCPEFEDGTNSIKISSCTSIEVRGITRACGNAYDGSLLRKANENSCFISKSNKRGWVEFKLEKTTKVAKIAILPKANGEGLLGAEFKVCQDSEDNCKTLGTVSSIGEHCAILEGRPATGNIIRASISGSGLVICEIRIFSS